MEESLRKIYIDFDVLYQGILSVCADCGDHDCEGYVWLLPEEASALYDLNISIVEINNNTSFINSFEEVNGRLLIERPKPPCKLRHRGLCSIYTSRPLVCRMYPIGFATIQNEVSVVLHKDCQFARGLKGREKELFLLKVLRTFEYTSPKLLMNIMDTYGKVDAISAFPDGSNIFEVIAPLRALINPNERR